MDCIRFYDFSNNHICYVKQDTFSSIICITWPCDVFVQFTLGEMAFLLHKCKPDGMGTLATSALIFGVRRDLFHRGQIANGLYKVEVSWLMLLDALSPFPNYKDDPLQLLLK